MQGIYTKPFKDKLVNSIHLVQELKQYANQIMFLEEQFIIGSKNTKLLKEQKEKFLQLMIYICLIKRCKN